MTAHVIVGIVAPAAGPRRASSRWPRSRLRKSARPHACKSVTESEIYGKEWQHGLS